MNPFRFGKVVTGDDFCPRPGVVQELRNCIGAAQNVAVLGERRTGKTSLIFETARRVRSLRLVYVQMWAVKSVDDIASRLLRAIATMKVREASFLQRVAQSLAHLRPRIDFDPVTGQPSITVMPGAQLTPAGLHGVFDFLEELSGQYRLVVALDEFQDIANLADAAAVLGEMRGRIQRQRKVPYVFAGSIRHEMERIFRDPSSPFYKSVRTIEVAALPRAEFRKYLDTRFAAGGRKFDVPAYDYLFELAQNNPGDVQQFCAAVWDVSADGDRIGREQLQAALEHVLATERKGFEAQVRNLTGNQIGCLKALARLGGEHPLARGFLKEAGIEQPASVKRALQRLIDLEIVYGPELDHKFFDPFFRQWVLSAL